MSYRRLQSDSPKFERLVKSDKKTYSADQAKANHTYPDTLITWFFSNSVNKPKPNSPGIVSRSIFHRRPY